MKARHARLMAWYIAAISTLVASVYSLPSVQLVALAALALLLSTTPPDAIQLSKGVSVVLIVAGAALMQSVAMLREQTAIAAVGAVAAALVITLALARSRVSPWWATLLVWGPWMMQAWWRSFR